ncbi:MAG: hypothetical protein ACE5KE_00105 [Methanosarcinales archaeon]
MDDVTPAIVIGNHVTSLHIIRSLGEKGIPTYLIHNDKLCVARFSRYCKGFFKSPSFITEKKQFLEYLFSIAGKESLKRAILIPTNDDTVYILSQNKVALEEHFVVPLPDWKIISRAADKKITLKIAKENGIPIPKSVYPENVEDMLDNIEYLQFPAVIKPSIGKKYYYQSGVKMHLVKNKKQAKYYYEKIAAIMGKENIIVQEYIPGGMDQLYNYGSVFKGGEPYGIFLGKKIRQHPRDFGVGTAAMTVDEPELERLGSLLLKSCGYEGIGYVEFKKDFRDGKFKLIEINPRHWNFVDLSIYAGVDLPYNLYLYAMGKRIPKQHTKAGLIWIHWWADFGQTLMEFLKGKENLLKYFKSIKGEKKFAVMSIKDPKPFIIESLILPYLFLIR